MDKKIKVEITINNKFYPVDVSPRLLLVDFLREHIHLTGTHIGCDTSQCGACMVFLNDKCVKSCSILLAQCDNKKVKTIESIGSREKLHKVQEAFREHHGLQCGFCTPGIIMSALEMKKKNIKKEKDIRKFLDGNLCRCTGYHNVVKSISSYINND